MRMFRFLMMFGSMCLLGGALSTPSFSAPKKKEALLEDRLSREQFNQVYREGPQRFIAGLHVKPVVKDGRFLGYKLTDFESNSPMKGGTYIQKGDVILSVNGRSLEKPDQFMKTWQMLRTAKVLEVRVYREDHTFTVRWHIAP